jgi:hypothetical protein
MTAGVDDAVPTGDTGEMEHPQPTRRVTVIIID